MKSFLRRVCQAALCALVAGLFLAVVSPAVASGNDDNRGAAVSPQAVVTTPEINAEATFAGPNGGQAQFFILDVENEQVTKKYLEGEFGYSDHRSRITFTTGKIQTVTVNGDQAAFTGTATIGGKHRQVVQFTVNVTANQDPATGDTFSISLSNGYSASGNLTTGWIHIQQGD
jgi:hypothetical protein